MSSTSSSERLPSVTGPPPGWKPKPKAQVQPGVVLDEDGKPCKICNSWQTWSKAKTGGEGGKGGKGQRGVIGQFMGSGGGSSSASSSSSPSTSEVDTEIPRPEHCPPDVNQLGRSTWTFLHTTAAYYPLKATPTQQSNMTSLLSSLSLLYPCTYCATDFREKMAEHKPDVSGRAGLSRWLCERHNEVNEKLGKSIFDCGEKNLKERWKDGPADGSCD